MDILDKLTIDPHLEPTLAQQIKQQLTWLIASGQLTPGDKLPSVRQLARHLAINLNTVRSAYQKMEVNGLVEIRQGLGTRVLPYDPNKLAQITRSVRTHTVGIILPTLYNPFYHELLQGIEDIARYTQTLLFVCDTHEDEKEAERYFAQLSVKQVDGVIVVSRDVSHFLPGNHLIKETYKPILPFVSVDWPESLGYSVIIDLENAGYQATRHLLEHDHHRIGLITFSQDTANVRPVNAGYFRALSEFGIAEEPELIARVPGFDIDAGMQGAQMLLSHEYPPTAIFTIADTLALGVMQAIHKAGQRIPDDVALTSFNDIVFANLVCPPLTTVAAPVREMGVQAMKMLQDLIAGKKPSKKCILLPTSLVVRQSCGCGQKN